MKILITMLICVNIVACASQPSVEPMALCDENEIEKIDPDVLNKALIKAEVWSNKNYGSDCHTCAEIKYVEEKNFTLHITSPGYIIYNTSATIEFRLDNARTLETRMFHGCKARIISEPEK